MFDESLHPLLGLGAGILFGFLLQKGRVSKFHIILGQFLLKDWTVVKVMTSAIAIGAIGVHALIHNGYADSHIKPFLVGGVLAGAALFGIGMAVLGYCPGTSVAAWGEGKRDAMFGVLGMFAGAGLFVALFPELQPLMHGLGDLGKTTLPQWLGVSTEVMLIGLVVLIGLMLALIEFLQRRHPDRPGKSPPRPAASDGIRVSSAFSARGTVP